MDEQVENLTARLQTALATGEDHHEIAALAMQLGAATATTIGECRVTPGDSATLYPVLDVDGMRWYCTHYPPHRTEVVAQRAP